MRRVALATLTVCSALAVRTFRPGTAFADGFGVNLLIGGDPVAPSGGAAFHDAAVWIKAETASSALAAE